MSSATAPTARLSCEQCKRRKTKCDKQDPCTACKSSGIQCITVQRARRPRGRTAQKGGDINNRVARLEDLVSQLKAQVQSGKEPSAGLRQDPIKVGLSQPKDSNVLQNYIAPEFWVALAEEANGIREILEEIDNEDGFMGPVHISPGLTAETSPRNILSTHNITGIDPASTQCLTQQMTSILLSIYRIRVDSIFKVLHWPSFLAVIRSKDAEFDISANSGRKHALRCAVYYTALCTMTDHESENLLSCEKGPLLNELKLSAETSISKAGLLEQPNVTVLQAFFIYLVGLRCATTSASSWTLLSVAVRLASALGLGSEQDEKYTIYEVEIRRRLFFSIGVMDTQLALDRGTLPMLGSKDFKHPPSVINDSDLYPTCTFLPTVVQFTDMSFSALTQQAMICQKKMYEPQVDPDDQWTGWSEKLAAISVFEQYIRANLSHINASSSPLQQFTQAVAGGTLANIQLMLRRPPYKSRHITARVPPWDNFDVMKATTDLLERSLDKKARVDFAPWAWFAWIKWYALAVLLAELCGSAKGLAADHSYFVAQRTFDDYSKVVADSESGMLWKPIVKLMRRVQRIRGNAVEVMPASSLSSARVSLPSSHSTNEVDHGPQSDIYEKLGINSQIDIPSHEASLAFDFDSNFVEPRSPNLMMTGIENILPSLRELAGSKAQC
ncbi:hypothetical protein BUE80_DR006933 [Diplocarpon rosae]|nr:hypothetical protein BUE80_DR006933 [Diplocarpon rosae]